MGAGGDVPLDSLIAAGLFSVEGLISISMVAIGLGMVIFFHELGHFAVAKWCGVQVERFSIGFGPILWGRKWGETEYALSAIPFGGYVKMLGQDDIDPSQETSTEVAENPRSYTAKSVPQRMAIISAGVIMNIITGYLFYVGAMQMGIQVSGNEIGFVEPGMPAWKAGLRADDELHSINGRPMQDFSDVTRGTALSTGPMRIVGRHADGQEFHLELTPDRSGTKRMIGVGPQFSPRIRYFPADKQSFVATPNSPAQLAANGFQPNDKIVSIGDEPVEDFSDLRRILTQRRSEALAFEVERRGEGQEAPRQQATVEVPAQAYRWLGLRMEIGEIEAVQADSPAAEAGLQPDDRIIRVQAVDAGEPLEVGRGLDPAGLPDWFADHAGQPVKVTIERESHGGETREFTLTPRNARNWNFASDRPHPMDIPAIGVVFEFVPRILSVEPGGPAEQAALKANDKVTRVEFLRPADWPVPTEKSNYTFDIGEHGWANVIGMLQARRGWQVQLTVRPGGQEPERTVNLTPVDYPGWFVSGDRGLLLAPATNERKAVNLAEAYKLGWYQTSDSMMDIYLTLRGLFTRNISARELHGPISIFSIGVQIASSGLAEFLVFLGFLSVNLAVLNFLPIPVLDGGHMVFLIWEGITGRKPNERVYATAMYFGLLFVLGLMGWVFYLDIMRNIG